MAYIVGVLSPEEEAELNRRGWQVEPAPAVDFDTGQSCLTLHRMRMVWVDQDMFKIMDGPDWDRGNTGDASGEDGAEAGDTLYERWWNCLTREQRTQTFANVRLQTAEPVEVFSQRLWHELHQWMREELRPLCREPHTENRDESCSSPGDHGGVQR
jgi:hypothetical protein